MLTTQEAGRSLDSHIRLVHPSALPFVWEKVLTIMRENPRGLLDGWFSEQEVYSALFTNQYDLWVGVDGFDDSEMDIEVVGLCRLEKYQAFSIYRIMWVGGKLNKHLDDAISQITAYSRQVAGADKLALDGRLGFVRLLSKYDFAPARFELWKTIGRSH